MDEKQPSRNDASQSPIPLNYRPPEPAPSAEPALNMPFAGQFILGFLAGCAAGYAMLVLAGSLFSKPSFRLVVSPYILLAALTCLAWWRWHWPGFLVGALIPAGLAALVFGLCFAGI